MKKNNKVVQGVLLVVVIMIWGKIAHSVFTYQSGFTAAPTYQIREITTTAATPAEAIPFDLLIDYEDPFLGNQSRKSRPVVAQATSSPPLKRANLTKEKEQVATPTFRRPNIIYRGFILTDRQVTAVRLDVNGKASTYRKGQNRNGFQIVAMARDSIQVLFEDASSGIIYRKR